MHKHHQTVEVFLALQPNVDETFVIINRNPGNAPLRFPGYGFPLHAATKGPALSYSRRNPIRPVSRVVSKDPFPFCCATIPFHRLVTCSISLQSQPQGIASTSLVALDVFVEMLKNKKTVIPRASFLFIGSGYALRDCLTLRYSQGCYPCVVPELPMGYWVARATRPRLHSSDGMPKLNSVTQLPKGTIYLPLLP